MQITSPLRIHAEIPAIVLHVPAGTDLLWRQAFEAATVLSELYEVFITIQRTLAVWQQRLGRMPRLGVIRDGAHAIPRLIGASTTV
jgi:hypothetical protein